MYKSLIKYNSKEAEKKYKTYKNKLTSILRIAEKVLKNYYNSKLQEYKSDMKNTWKILNDITQRKKKNNIVCSEFLIGNKKIVDNREISNFLCEYRTKFSQKYRNLSWKR